MVGKKYLYFSSRAVTLLYQFSESNEPFLDRLDIFSDATDLKNTLVLLFLRHLLPQRRSRKKVFFLQTYVISLHEFCESPLHLIQDWAQRQCSPVRYAAPDPHRELLGLRPARTALLAQLRQAGPCAGDMSNVTGFVAVRREY